MKKVIAISVAATILLTGCANGGMVEREPFQKTSSSTATIESEEAVDYVLPPEALQEFVKTYNEKQSVPAYRVPDAYKVYLKNGTYYITDEEGENILSMKLDSNGNFLSASSIGQDSQRNILSSIAIMDSLKDREYVPIEAKEEIAEIYRKIQETERQL